MGLDLNQVLKLPPVFREKPLLSSFPVKKKIIIKLNFWQVYLKWLEGQWVKCTVCYVLTCFNLDFFFQLTNVSLGSKLTSEVWENSD